MFDLPPPDPGIEISLASRGISKGIVQTEGPQVVVRPELAFGPLFAGAYAKNVSSPTSDGEAGPIVGVRGRAGGLDLSMSATLKLAVAPVGAVDFDTDRSGLGEPYRARLVGSMRARF